MAKKDVVIDTGLNISEVTVSQAAKDRVIKLRAELRNLMGSYSKLGTELSGTRDFSERERILLSQREAINRASSIGRRLGYTPEQMGEFLATRSGLNRELSAVRSGRTSLSRAAVAAEIQAQKQKELYDWLVDAAEVVTGPDVDQSRPIVQRARRRVRNQLGGMLMTPGVENIIGDEKARKAAELYDKLVENTEATGSLITTLRSGIAAGAGGIAFGSMLSSKAASILGNRDTPFTEFRSDMHQALKATGGIIGAAVGSLAGPIGAAVGGAVGAWLGGYAERSKSASDTGKADSLEALRMRNLYGGSRAGSYMMMRLMGSSGYATSADFEGLASAANIAPFSAAFGKISEDQWTALSFMPNYFNALFNGATPEEQLAAYRRDQQILGPGMGQLMTQMMGGLGVNENTRAFVNSEQYVRWLNAREDMRGYDWELEQYLSGYEDAVMREAKKNRQVEMMAVRRGTMTISPYNYAGNEALYGYEPGAVTSWMGRQSALPMFNFDSMGFVKRDLNIIINNEKVNVGSVYTRDEDAGLYNYSSYTVGSYQ